MDEEGRVSYEAARNYHFDRDPPVSYLIRVSKIFNVSLEWLATEVGAFESGPEIEDFVAKAFGATGSEEVEQAHLLRRAFQEGAGAEWEWEGVDSSEISHNSFRGEGIFDHISQTTMS